MIRVFLQIFTVCVLVAITAGAPAFAQNLFITPNKDKSVSDKAENALPGIVVRPGTASRFNDRSTKVRKQKVYKKKVQKKDNPDFDIFKKVKGLDLNLMRANGREPKNQEELRLVSAAYSMPQVSGMLEMKRKIEADLAAKMARANQKDARTDYLKSVAAKNKRAQAAKAKIETPEAPSDNKAPKIFNNYR